MASPFLVQLHQTIDTHLSDIDFGILEICDILDISRGHLHRKIKAETGCTTSEYIRTYRLHKAKDLLTTTNLRVSEVALSVGFKSVTYFSTSYQEVFGFPPKDTKKN